jgi:hypothetical protein
MRGTWWGMGVAVAVCVAGGALAQETAPAEAEARALLERVEAVANRPFDPRFRAWAEPRLARLGDRELGDRFDHAASAGLGGLQAPGDFARDLVYTPVAPCRIVDTRAAGGSLAAGVPRSFRVTGVGLDVQGGSIAGCGVPVGLASGVILNFVAVNPAGPGNLRAWAYASAPVPPPNASILNYNAGANIANGLAIPICDPTAPDPCPQDFRVQADGNGAQLVVDVVGYFHRLATEAFQPTVTLGQGGNLFGVTTACANVTQIQVAVDGPGTIVVEAHPNVGISHGAGTDDIHLSITPVSAQCPPLASRTARFALPASAATGSFYVLTAAAQRSFSVDSAGTYTYYLTAIQAGNDGQGDYVDDYAMRATFFPSPN